MPVQGFMEAKLIRKQVLLCTICLVAMAFLPATTNGQTLSDTYRTGIGVRLGNTPGITVKRFLSDRGALEGILHIFRNRNYDGFLVTGLYQWHVQAFEIPRLHWYFGAGLHAGAYQLRDANESISGEEPDNNGTLYGADLVIGLEYQFRSVPFTVGADFKPSLSVPNNRLNELNGAVNVRWVF